MRRMPLSSRTTLRAHFVPSSHDSSGLSPSLRPLRAPLTAMARFLGMFVRALVLLGAVSLLAIFILIGVIVHDLSAGEDADNNDLRC